MLMTDAGFSRDANGSFAHPNGKQVNVDFAVQAASEIQQMQTILSNSWTQAGFTVRDDVIDPRVFSQLQTRHTLPGFAYSFYGGEEAFVSTEIGTSANRWRGRNRSGWVSPDYDRVYDAWRSELDAKARGGDVAQMIALVTDNVIGVSLYFSQGVITWGSDLHGPTDKQASKFGTTSRATTPYFDIEKWTFAS